MYTLLQRVQRHIRRTGISPTVFGRLAINDPRLIDDLKRGRECRPDTVRRIERYLAEAAREGRR